MLLGLDETFFTSSSGFCTLHYTPLAIRDGGGIHLLKSGYRPVALSYALLLSRHTKGALPYNLADYSEALLPHWMQPLSVWSSLPYSHCLMGLAYSNELWCYEHLLWEVAGYWGQALMAEATTLPNYTSIIAESDWN